MNTSGRALRYAVAFLLLLLSATSVRVNAGVTIITHGLNGNTDDWVDSMADAIPNYPRFLGNNFTTYRIDVTYSSGFYYLSWLRESGVPPSTPESGEIIVKLDWRTLANNSFSTYQVAEVVAYWLQLTNLISEMSGHALSEFPLHLVGHSRGGSLMCELSRQLGTNGVWIDHLTTIDPHPLNNDGFADFPYTVIDAPARTYETVLFHDNYWQNLNFFFYGEPVFGAYTRKLTFLDGGYGGAAASHSDVHLWYHGTIDWNTPTSDSAAALTSYERQNWWTSYELYGFDAGFLYSLIGGSDRTSTVQPVGPGFEMIRDGYNQWWDLGAGVANNRTALPTNNGNWPNLVKFNRTTTNQVVQGQTMPVKFYYQWAKPNVNLATISIYLDDDLNPINTNQTLLRQITVPGNGASSISFSTTNLTLFASNAAPGYHTVLAKITGGGRTRYLYAPELVQVISIHY